MNIVASPVRTLVLAVPLLFWVACAAPESYAPKSAPEPSSPAETPVKLGEEFQLSPRGKAAIAEKEATVEFVQVTEDSRCPIDARCIWAGQVTVLLRVGRQDQSPAELKLTLRVDGEEATSAQAGDLEIRLLSVEPYPETGKSIEQAEYKARLVVQ